MAHPVLALTPMRLQRLATLLPIIAIYACGGAPSKGSADTANDLSPEEANERDLAACKSGDGDACGQLGTSLWLEAATTGGSQKEALKPLQAACAHDDWRSCLTASSIVHDSGGDARSLAQKGADLATAACSEGPDLGACLYMGEWAMAANDKDAARRYYTAACRELRGVESNLLAKYPCERALAAGASKKEFISPPAPSTQEDRHAASTPRAAPKSLVKPRRTHGQTNISPPAQVFVAARKHGFHELRAVTVLCLSETGRPIRIFFARPSGSLPWDRRIFETMRNWRYQPAAIDGKPAQTCTTVTFVAPIK
jgi:hypothetical protein